MKNERHNAQLEILKRKRHQQTRTALYEIPVARGSIMSRRSGNPEPRLRGSVEELESTEPRLRGSG